MFTYYGFEVGLGFLFVSLEFGFSKPTLFHFKRKSLLFTQILDIDKRLTKALILYVLKLV